MSKLIPFFVSILFLVGCDDDGPGNAGPPEKDGEAKVEAAAPFPRATNLASLDLAGDRQLIAPLADAYRRIDATVDGWESEAFSEKAASQLDRLAESLQQNDTTASGALSESSIERLAALVTADFRSSSLRPQLAEVRNRDGLLVSRFDPSAPPTSEDRGTSNQGKDGFVAAMKGLLRPGNLKAVTHAKFKVSHVEVTDNKARTRVLVQLDGPSASTPGITQINATWDCSWSNNSTEQPLLVAIEVVEYEEVVKQGKTLFSDMTEAVVGDLDSFRKHYAFGVDHWRLRIPAQLGMAVTGHHGLAVGDVNGDGLEDVYLCADGGLPNRLLIQEPDGRFRDATPESGADWLDSSASALLLDLDNDGDQDLVVGLAWHVVLMENDGSGRFSEKAVYQSRGQILSMAVADFDQDGDLDLFLCGYQGDGEELREGALAMPIPFHDANNGGANTLLKNQGSWKFEDQTTSSGLDQNNQRFSFAAVWEDYDNDGDLDLYVANDFGRNNLYRNQEGVFTDVAAAAGVEDKAAGMSAGWSDVDHDGHMDLYISNMFSNAGNRITYQNQFNAHAGAGDKADFQRFARGNTLFQNLGNGQFSDISEPAGVTMGRWAWGSVFADFNNDSLEDIIVANGFITSTDTGDL
ncbi:MAG: hypothetical protein ACJAQT_000620 [Akkermansiaceae bacterium]|jgi:hypothetical protein